MRMAAELDSGPILIEREVEIGTRETASELSPRLADAGAALLLETLRGLSRGDLEAYPQDENEVSWAPRLEKADGAVDWSLPAHVIYNRYRAYSPWPGLTTSFRGQQVKLVTCSVLEGGAEDGDIAPGTVVGRTKRLTVACGDGSLLAVEALQKPGRRELSGLEFANGERLDVGERFGSSS